MAAVERHRAGEGHGRRRRGTVGRHPVGQRRRSPPEWRPRCTRLESDRGQQPSPTGGQALWIGLGPPRPTARAPAGTGCRRRPGSRGRPGRSSPTGSARSRSRRGWRPSRPRRRPAAVPATRTRAMEIPAMVEKRSTSVMVPASTLGPSSARFARAIGGAGPLEHDGGRSSPATPTAAREPRRAAPCRRRWSSPRRGVRHGPGCAAPAPGRSDHRTTWPQRRRGPRRPGWTATVPGRPERVRRPRRLRPRAASRRRRSPDEPLPAAGAATPGSRRDRRVAVRTGRRAFPRPPGRGRSNGPGPRGCRRPGQPERPRSPPCRGHRSRPLRCTSARVDGVRSPRGARRPGRRPVRRPPGRRDRSGTDRHGRTRWRPTSAVG